MGQGRTGPSFLVIAVVVLGVAAMAAVFVFKADLTATPRPQGEGTPPSKEIPVVAQKSSQPPADESRRVPVAGQEGYFVVFMQDGTSYLEAPDGKKTQLVDAAFARRPDPDRVAARLAAKLAPKDKDKREPGQLIVLDEGVVDVPKDAQITLIEKDRLVVMNGDGSSTVYYADGKTELREKRKAPTRGRKDGD
jgi:hypothetical protein